MGGPCSEPLPAGGGRSDVLVPCGRLNNVKAIPAYELNVNVGQCFVEPPTSFDFDCLSSPNKKPYTPGISAAETTPNTLKTGTNAAPRVTRGELASPLPDHYNLVKPLLLNYLVPPSP